MSEIDFLKETIAYLKFWLGVLVVSNISLFGWLLTHAREGFDFKVTTAILGVVVITLVIYFFHKHIQSLISKLKGL